MADIFNTGVAGIGPFSCNEAAIMQIKNDKHRLLEGYIPEILLADQFLVGSCYPYSKGWWMAIHHSKPLYFCVRSHPEDFDWEVYSVLSRLGDCWFICVNADKKCTLINNRIQCNEREFLSRYGVTVKHQPNVATEEIRDEDRQNKAIEFFISRNCLTSIAEERFVANNFLSVFFKYPVNIDFFYKKGNALRVGEVKFKYPSQSGTYGVDYGQMEMFKGFIETGLEVFYFILRKTIKRTDVSIFDFLASNEKKSWIFTSITKKIIGEVSTAPSHTNINGRHTQNYYNICESYFRKLDDLKY